MKLKEMSNTGVILATEEEFDEYVDICRRGGFHQNRQTTRDGPMEHIKRGGLYVSAVRLFWYGKVSLNGGFRDLITLKEFKKEQGIMKYKEGDVLVYGNHEIKILGVCGSVYFISEEDRFTQADNDIYTEEWLDDYGYKLKTDEPEMVELTLEDVAKLKGIPVETLRIKD